jgi:hypothetical protein
MSNDLSNAIRLIITTAETKPQELGELLYEPDDSGHTLLCRVLHQIAHHGPSGTFVRLDSLKLQAGGYLCSFGVQCGQPTASLVEQHAESMEATQRLLAILRQTGALETMIWENPGFSVVSLCKCGHSDERQFPLHDPLCPYRTEHGIQPTIEEYRAALGGKQ